MYPMSCARQFRDCNRDGGNVKNRMYPMSCARQFRDCNRDGGYVKNGDNADGYAVSSI